MDLETIIHLVMFVIAFGAMFTAFLKD